MDEPSRAGSDRRSISGSFSYYPRHLSHSVFFYTDKPTMETELEAAAPTTR
ncbi:hypothetical protein NJ7G_2083 [Natrinema sp. J7-2]|nr:hypothetical protein NJ7G_2083 [Natrinema sp. J7-2]